MAMKLGNKLGNKLGSVFSGIGGLDLGFLKKGFEFVFHVEQQKNACKTLRHNTKYFGKNLNIFEQDIQTIPLHLLKDYIGLDGLIGGPPCEAYSSARGEFDETDAKVQEKISLTYTYIQWVGYLQPRFFLFENTKGMTHGTKKHIFHDVLRQLEKQGYRVKHKILNAHEYANAQKRERVFIVGVRNDQDWEFEFPEPVPMEQRKFVRDILDPIGTPFVGKELRPKFKKIMSYVPPGGYWKSLPDHLIKEVIPAKQYELYSSGQSTSGGMTGVCRRLHPDRECPTITKDPGQNQTLCVVPHEDRLLSVSECKRAQGFPEDYEILGDIKDQYTGIGNAVAVEMATALAEQFASCLGITTEVVAEKTPEPIQVTMEDIPFEDIKGFEQLSLF